MPKKKTAKRKGAARKVEAKPTRTYLAFAARYPDLEKAWSSIHRAGEKGPLDERTTRLVKLGVAMGALREGAVHASVRKARAMGISTAALEQVVALAAGTIGLPAAAAVFSWIRDRQPRRR